MLQCKICFDDIIIDNIIYYNNNNVNNDNINGNNVNDNLNNKIFDYCIDCLAFLLDTLWYKYVDLVKTCDCKVALRRLLSIGPPFYFRDEQINEGKDIICFYTNDSIIDGKTKGSLDIKYKQMLLEKLNECNVYTLNIDDILNSFWKK